MDEFCGSTFWDLNQTWYTDHPDFTECFHQSVLVWIPCGLMWILAPYEIYQILDSKSRSTPWSIFNISKLIINLMLILLAISSIVYAAYETNNDGLDFYNYPVYYVTPAIMAITFVMTLAFLLAGKKKGIRSSGPLFLFWFVLAVCGAFTYRTRVESIYNGLSHEEEYPFVWTMIYYPLVVFMFFINCFADVAPRYDSEEKSNNPSPEEGASMLSTLTYYWFRPLAWKGYRKPLESKDLWDINEKDKCRSIVPIYDKHWENSLKKAAKKKSKSESKSQQYADQNDDGTEDSKPKVPSIKLVSILPALCKTFGADFLFGGLMELIQDLLSFVSPQIQKLLIDFVVKSGIEMWKGYLYAIIMTLTAMTRTIFLSQYNQKMFVIGMRIRTVVVSNIYRKAIRISNSARKESTVGEIVNLMSVDAQRLQDLTLYLNLLWSAPLQIGLSIYFLYDTLGPSVFAGLGVMILLIPINGVLANTTKKLQLKQMKYKDKRVKMMNEILSGIKVLKLYAWEPSFQNKIETIRNAEVKVLKQAAYLSAGTYFLWTCAPFLVSLFSFVTFVLVSPENTLSPDKAFVSLTLFNMIRVPMTMLPVLIIMTVQGQVSLKRLNKFMNGEELDPEAVTHETTSSASPVNIEKGSFAWATGEPPVLKDINLEVKLGKLVAVVGSVGSGKSSLIAAMLGEMEKITGSVNTTGRVAYIPQQAWIQNCTLRDNITFAKPYDEDKYNQVIECCALKADLAMLPGGDSTEIGEKGINLSGGQKQRVSLARAVYSDMEVYFLDDPLSAVDSHVGKHIFDKVIGPKGLLKGKTRVLVTHGITFLPQVDQIIVLKDGEITETGSYKELLTQKGAFAEFLLQHLEESGGDEEIPDDLAEIKLQLESTLGKEELTRQTSRQRSQFSESQMSEGGRSSNDGNLSRTGSTNSTRGALQRRSSIKKPAETTTTTAATAANTKLIDAEKTETGKVKNDIYVHYFRAVGIGLTLVTFVFYCLYQGANLYSNIWLSDWSNDYAISEEHLPPNFTHKHSQEFYLGIYGGLGLAQSVFQLIGSITFAMGTIAACKMLHEGMLERMMTNPMSFFDTTPIGRIVNRFSKDVDVVDNTLPMTLRTALICFLAVIATVIVIGQGYPIFFAFAIPIGVLYYWIQDIYVATSRQLKRLESVSRSPIYSHFGETLTGAMVIRAYGQEQRFIKESESRVDYNQVCYYPSIIANRWLSVRLETIGNLVVLFAAIFAVIGRENGIDPGLVGLSISYALTITQSLNWFMRMTSEVETNIVAVERVREYTNTPQEAAWEHGKVAASKDWPEKGNVVFQNYQVRYREGLDLVLKGISCEIHGGEKVGIVGRTGAGKSSLTLGLFRIIEAAGGSITIDGINIADLGLHPLRSRLTIIPQDPVLFSGTLRMNLDPFNSYSDDEVWTALEHAHLKTFVKSLPTGLEHEASEGGENLSVGQRQLICLARALLRKTKVLILDEATAAVDLETDDLIQATIRKEFKECTVITIAHRLNTIMDSNRVMVLDKGEIREYASPNELLANSNTIFYGMAKDAGLV